MEKPDLSPYYEKHWNYGNSRIYGPTISGDVDTASASELNDAYRQGFNDAVAYILAKIQEQ